MNSVKWTLNSAYEYATEHAQNPTSSNGEAVYNCPFEPCKKQFSKRFNLKAHLRVHTGDKPFQCKYEGCGRRFMWKSSLTSHELGHTRRSAESEKRSAVATAAAAAAAQHHNRTHSHFSMNQAVYSGQQPHRYVGAPQQQLGYPMQMSQPQMVLPVHQSSQMQLARQPQFSSQSEQVHEPRIHQQPHISHQQQLAQPVGQQMEQRMSQQIRQQLGRQIRQQRQQQMQQQRQQQMQQQRQQQMQQQSGMEQPHAMRQPQEPMLMDHQPYGQRPLPQNSQAMVSRMSQATSQTHIPPNPNQPFSSLPASAQGHTGGHTVAPPYSAGFPQEVARSLPSPHQGHLMPLKQEAGYTVPVKQEAGFPGQPIGGKPLPAPAVPSSQGMAYGSSTSSPFPLPPPNAISPSPLPGTPGMFSNRFVMQPSRSPSSMPFENDVLPPPINADAASSPSPPSSHSLSPVPPPILPEVDNAKRRRAPVQAPKRPHTGPSLSSGKATVLPPLPTAPPANPPSQIDLHGCMVIDEDTESPHFGQSVSGDSPLPFAPNIGRFSPMPVSPLQSGIQASPWVPYSPPFSSSGNTSTRPRQPAGW